ncbi:flagellar basal body-associated FliL family protein [Aquisalimonas lutea]|uniref:flagellar basal body-associated FliL family protein n=1 Tax=Aquisalimonas lutea TaxID=1327750 RepID=UPI0025B521E4|nr:flagellar basal body-associated FliL family protein [Aquisalimonas lutea]MDN3518286.1 flagellar basal body-associated FliL family protein [Aquisalimonas lutea]
MHVSGKAGQRGSSKLVVILLIGLIVVLLAVGTAAALYLTGIVGSGDGDDEVAEEQTEGDGEDAAPQGPAQYMELEDAITVNIQRDNGRRAILQAQVQVMARDEKAFSAIESHMPVIRNNLISLFGDQSYESVASSEGKNALRQEARDEINAVLEEQGVDSRIEAVYFTRLVTQ